MAKRQREASDLWGMLNRTMRALAERAAEGDIEALAVLVSVEKAAVGWSVAAVSNLRAEPWDYSWSDIGRALGITRQAAQQRFGGGDDQRCDKCHGLVKLHKRPCER